MVRKTTGWTLLVQNIYDIYGNLIFAKDESVNHLHKYSIDTFGNTTKEELFKYTKETEEQKETLTSLLKIENQYDEYHSNIVKTFVTFEDNQSTKLNYDYTLSDDPNAKLLKVNLDQGVDSKKIFEQEIKYDKLNRINKLSNLICQTEKSLNKEFAYLKYGNQTSNLISTIKYSNDGLVNDRLTYKYDKNGNIIEIRQQGQILARYKYDSLSRLIREDNKEFEKTITFEYDGGGNILCKKLYNFTLVDNLEFESANEIISYTYPIDGWRDQLKEFNGKEIKDYDELGNPWHYRGNELLWSHGRQLDKFGDISTYTYNSNGIRTSKITNGFTTKFYLTGNKIIRQYDHINDMYFYYGADGLTGFNLNGSDYYYKKNAQNDIIGIYSTDGTQICKYFYDAWGNQVVKYLNSSGEYVTIESGYQYNDTTILNRFVAYKNPFRYRSYYYDFETGLYYLNSRYYDPQTGRFINADNIDILTKTQDIINGLNLYAYCLNNPVNNIDENGDIPSWLKWLIGGLILIAAVVTIVVTGGAATGLISAIAIGAAKGALVGAGIGLATGITTGLITGDWSGLADSFMWGAIGGAISGGISGGFGFGANAGISIYGDIVKNGIVLGNKLNMSLQIFVSIGTYVGQTLTSGEELSVAGFVFAILGGVAGGTLFKDLASPMIINVLNSLQDIVRNIRKKFLPSEFLDWLM